MKLLVRTSGPKVSVDDQGLLTYTGQITFIGETPQQEIVFTYICVAPNKPDMRLCLKNDREEIRLTGEVSSERIQALDTHDFGIIYHAWDCIEYGITEVLDMQSELEDEITQTVEGAEFSITSFTTKFETSPVLYSAIFRNT
jgi:hypothetical protein